MFLGRPQSFLLTTVLLFMVIGGEDAALAAAAGPSILRLSSATNSRWWLISAGRSAGIPISAQSELDSVSLAAGLPEAMNPMNTDHAAIDSKAWVVPTRWHTRSEESCKNTRNGNVCGIND